jgi:hypothetical protein
MTKLALDHAPVVNLPRRFLLSMPVWGLIAGVLLMADGDASLRSRWYPGTLALVHAYTLGVLGNAMFGSLLQFLPAAAGVRLCGERVGPWMHGALNVGALLLVGGLYENSRAAMMTAALMLPVAFALLVGMTLPGISRATGQHLLRMGMGTALASAMGAASLGGTLAWGCAGIPSLELPAWVDVHASVAVLAWVVMLLASVGRVVMPMFMGTGVPPVRFQAAWLVSLVVFLTMAVALRLQCGAEGALSAVLAIFGLSFALTVFWLQRRTPMARRGPLWWSWRAGAMVLGLSAVALPFGKRMGMLAGALALGVALPLIIVGMALEIVAFLGWIELHRRVGRGVQLPSVQRLMLLRERATALLALLVGAAPLIAAVWTPDTWLIRLAGLAQCVAWLLVAFAFFGTLRRVRLFLRNRVKVMP